MIPELLVFDPALCCSTGICNPEVDTDLVRFVADLEWLGAQGVKVKRFNLAQEPTAFIKNAIVRQTLQSGGTECLPLIPAAGEIVSRGRYPAREELVGWSRRMEPSVVTIGGTAADRAAGCC